jgi:hypothetical protein
MAITDKDLRRLLKGQKAVVSACEAAEHGDNRGCLCALKGAIVTIGKPYETVFAGTPTWWITNDKTARMSELTLLVEPKD